MRRRFNPRQWWVGPLLAIPTHLRAQVDLRLNSGADSYFSPMARTLLTYGPPLLQLIYVVAALLAIGQGYTIFQRMMAGEEGITKSIVQWAGALLVLVGLAYALDLYLTATAGSIGYRRMTTE